VRCPESGSNSRYLARLGSSNPGLSLPNPEEELLKAKPVSKIADVIKKRDLTQVQAGELMGLTQSKVSELCNGRTETYSVERLYIPITSSRDKVSRERISSRPRSTPAETRPFCPLAAAASRHQLLEFGKPTLQSRQSVSGRQQQAQAVDEGLALPVLIGLRQARHRGVEEGLGLALVELDFG
jgi:predicted XRE-type DNA-binding protein